MAKIESRKKQNPKLQQSELSDGRASLYLEYYLGRTETPVLDENGQQVYYTTGAMAGKPKYQIKHSRKKENLNLYIWLHPRSQQERVQNKNTLALAEKIRFEREQTFLEDREGYRLRKEMDEDFMEFCKEFIKMPSLTKYTRITLKHGLQKFMDFLAATPRYALYKNNLKMTQLTVDMIAAYVEYLKENGTGDGPKIYFRMFKRMVTAAVDKDLIKKNPCRGFVLKNDNMTLQKEILLPEEIQQLVATHFEGERTEIHRAFIFGLYTGIRWCDTVSLTHANVDFSAKILRFNQQKTEGRSAHSGVTIPLSPTLLKLIGNPIQHTSEKIFNITCYRTTAITRLQKWVKAAGINKTITWHCARHSFAVNVLGAGANIKTVASLMGHSSIKMTEKYLHVIDQQKQDAINSLGDLDYDCEAVSL
ncbi:site-specific integrase [Muribaculaceae bacterium Isolate-105 (HZI)]|uniref:tyrosine-type recombinase/integrase n=2 Tax=Paramuribaculum intestinale TaxID=2094151 RepID=UPI000F46CD0A|nr:site-specific integrase [Paramuribaculum intestinale]ROT12018.1 site-specific integrase [Muribaculaceae bacterium Isolate-105 (HZI)]